MKTKIFFKLNIVWQLIALFFLTLTILALYCIVYAFIENVYLVVLIMIFPTAFCMFTFIRFEHDPIVLKKDCITMQGDWLGWKEKIQYKVKIEYSEIEQIQLIHTSKNSLGKTIRRVSAAIPLTYMEFICKDGTHKRVFVLYHTKKQRIKMINEIKARMKQVGNNVEIGDTIELVDNIKKI